MDEVVTYSKIKGVAVIQLADDDAINNKLGLSFTKKLLASDNIPKESKTMFFEGHDLRLKCKVMIDLHTKIWLWESISYCLQKITTKDRSFYVIIK